MTIKDNKNIRKFHTKYNTVNIKFVIYRYRRFYELLATKHVKKEELDSYMNYYLK